MKAEEFLAYVREMDSLPQIEQIEEREAYAPPSPEVRAYRARLERRLALSQSSDPGRDRAELRKLNAANPTNVMKKFTTLIDDPKADEMWAHLSSLGLAGTELSIARSTNGAGYPLEDDEIIRRLRAYNDQL